MKLKIFKEKNNKKVGIILFTITCILLISGVILYRTFAIFETNDEFNVINGSVEDMGDVQFVFYIDDEISKSAPEISSDYSLDTTKSHCTNGALVYWNDTTERAEVDNLSNSKTKCYLYFNQIYKEEILHGAIPDLGNGRLIPITISDKEKPSDVNYTNNESKYGGKVYKADITKDWYSYEQKRWANAIILKDGVVNNYKPGDEIPESAIESYFVWIPRYKYQLQESESTYNGYTEISHEYGEQSNNDQITNKGVNNSYEIIFETKDIGLSTGTQQKEYLTHPAFTSFNSNGMWVGKFETGTTLTNDYNVTNSSSIRIKPNVISWRNIQVANAFYTSYGYLRELESHMMKNMEWGAIFYLTKSKYGRCNGDTCTEPRFNNNGKYITGYSASFDPTCGWTGTSETCNKYEFVELNQDGDYGYSYYNNKSVVASTTGNYYGVFDISGGAWEYVMGVLQSSENDASPASGRTGANNYNSGFKGKYSCYTCDDGTEPELTNGSPWPSNKYYDLYDYNISAHQYQRGHLGDATKELGPFYSVTYSYGSRVTRYISSYYANESFFIFSASPWFMRGGSYYYGSETGIGAFYNTYGQMTGDVTFRVVLMP